MSTADPAKKKSVKCSVQIVNFKSQGRLRREELSREIYMRLAETLRSELFTFGYKTECDQINGLAAAAELDPRTARKILNGVGTRRTTKGVMSKVADHLGLWVGYLMSPTEDGPRTVKDLEEYSALWPSFIQALGDSAEEQKATLDARPLLYRGCAAHIPWLRDHVTIPYGVQAGLQAAFVMENRNRFLYRSLTARRQAGKLSELQYFEECRQCFLRSRAAGAADNSSGYQAAAEVTA